MTCSRITSSEWTWEQRGGGAWGRRRRRSNDGRGGVKPDWDQSQWGAQGVRDDSRTCVGERSTAIASPASTDRCGYGSGTSPQLEAGSAVRLVEEHAPSNYRAAAHGVTRGVNGARVMGPLLVPPPLSVCCLLEPRAPERLFASKEVLHCLPTYSLNSTS